MATYYVDATAGDDSKDGLSEANAWQTIAKVSGETFAAGDSILFKRGETWTGTALVVPSSGSAGSSITFADYGTGVLPIIDGDDTVDCIETNGATYIIFRNLEVTQGLDFGLELNNTSYIDIVDCVAHDCGNDNICIINQTHHVTVHGCISYDPYERVGGPRISCLEIADEAHDIIVSNCDLYGSPQAGITIHSHSDTEFPYNVTIQNCKVHDNDLFGITISQDNAGASLPADAAIHILSSQFNDNAGGAGTGGGAWIPVNAGDPYPAGILFEDCEFISAYDRPVYVGGRSTYRRCVMRANYATQVDTAQSTVFEHCVFYRAGAGAFETINSPNGVQLRNCILWAESNGQVNIRAGTTNVDMDYNLYWNTAYSLLTTGLFGWSNGSWYTWANWKTNSGQDAHSPTPANPLFMNATAHKYELWRSSPARNVGTDVGLHFVGMHPDCGAYEIGGVAGRRGAGRRL